MISLLTLRFMLWVGAASLAIGALYWGIDKIGDIREASVRAEYAAAIDDVNDETIPDNEKAMAWALRDARLREKAVAAFKASQKGQCPLTADEALKITEIR